jgi:hypothetical protein
MRTSWFYRVVASIIISILLLTACQKPNSNASDEALPSSTTIAADPGSLDETPETPVTAPAETTPPEVVESTSTEDPETTPQPTATPIVETRLPPEQWREWPVIPELTGREMAIYQHGLSLGNDPTHFSKVGDCQAIKEVLMGIYDQPDRYTLTENQSYLQETISHFAGSFNRDGQGVRGGFNAAAVLSPLWADPEACQPGESPIACEYRIHRPSFVIISLEVWWEGRTVERYEEYMRQILDFYIERGVVPILSTKADNVEGDHRINLATARLAYEYHLPLWNFWRAVQPLPNHGIDPDRDGFHISYEAWSVRSFTALQTLDAVWRGVRDQTPSNAPETPAVTQEAMDFLPILMSPEPAAPPLPPNETGIFFSMDQRSGDAYQSAGVFAYIPTNQSFFRLLESGYRLEDISPTGTELLVSQGSHLYLASLNGETEQITESLALSPRNASAFWLSNGTQLLVLTAEKNANTLWLVDLPGETWQTIASGPITGILKPVSSSVFYWYQGQCPPESGCVDNTLWQGHAGSAELFVEANQVVVSPDGQRYAWAETTEEDMIVLYRRTTDQSLQDFVYLPGNRLLDLAWDPFSQRLAVLTATRSDYSGKSSDTRIFVVDANTMSFLEYFAFPGLNPSVHWSADGGSLLLASTLNIETGYQVHLRQMNLTSGLFETFEESLAITSEGFITISELMWTFP